MEQEYADVHPERNATPRDIHPKKGNSNNEMNVMKVEACPVQVGSKVSLDAFCG